MKPKFKELYRDMAERVASLSYARRLKVGAIIVKDDRIISIGYNGMPAGWDNDCEMAVSEQVDLDSRTVTPEQLVTRPEVLHAESNAIAKVARSTESSEGADLFITHSPCMECAKLIYQSGISRVFYSNKYRDDSGVKFLKQSGVEVIHYDDE